MTAQNSKLDQDRFLLAAHRRYRWLVDNRARIKQGDPAFRRRPDYWRLHSELAYAIEDGLVTASGGKLLGRQPMSPRDQMRSLRARQKLEAAGLIELHALGNRSVTHLRITPAGISRAETLLQESQTKGSDHDHVQPTATDC